VLLTGAILTETIFSWPGIGKWMVDSVFRRDYPVIQGGLLIIAGMIMLVNLGSTCSTASSTRASGTEERSMANTQLAASADLDPSLRRRLADFWYYFSENRGAVIGLVVFVVLVLVALLASVIAPHPPTAQYRDAVLLPPLWQEGGRAGYLLGTDAVGRDIFSRLVYGAQFSLFIGVVVTTIALVGGIVVGVFAGYFGGWLDTVIMRVMDIILAFPSLLLALVLVAVLGPGLTNAMIAIALVLQPHFVRLTRAAVMAEKNREYVIAARVAGAGRCG
jgi:dipeptide transport system permease protein